MPQSRTHQLKKASLGGRRAAINVETRQFIDQAILNTLQRCEIDRFASHADELVVECRTQRQLPGKEHFVHGPVVPGQVRDEAVDESRLPAKQIQHLHDVEHVPRMLPIHRSNPLASVEFAAVRHRNFDIGR